MLLAFACYKNFILYQMDVESAFLNGLINEEVYVEQSPGFENFKFPNHVFKLLKTLYGLKQTPKAWYERLSKFLISSGFKMGKIEVSKWEKLIQLSSLSQMIMTCLLFKSMLMILYLVLLMFHFVKSLPILSIANLR